MSTRHSPDRAAGLVLRQHRSPAGDEAGRALDAIAAHPGEHYAERSGAVDRADRGEHGIDRRHAAAAALAVSEPHDNAVFGWFQRQMRIAGGEQDEVGTKLHSILGHHRLALGDCAELPGEHGHKRNRQMLGDENGHADPLGQGVKQHAEGVNPAGRSADC